LVFGSDYRFADDFVGVPSYQFVNTATDYADVGAPVYLQFDGVDDALSTASIDFTSTDEMTVCAGVAKDTTLTNLIAELSVSTITENGAFNLYSGSTYGVAARGTILGALTSVTVGTESVVVSGLYDISGDSLKIGILGSEAASTLDMGSGNFGNYALYIASRAGTSFYFDGRIHQLIVRGKSPVGNLIRRIEEYVANKTGVSL